MTKQQINKLLENGDFPDPSLQKELIETHISWVILCDKFVYKIKKPLKFSFLDFTSAQSRKEFCEREVTLNRRFTDEVYIEVVEILLEGEKISVGGPGGNVIDYAVKMHKLDGSKQMNRLQEDDKVTATDIKNLALTVTEFHKKAKVIKEKDAMEIRVEFNDLRSEREFIYNHAGEEYGEMVDHAIRFSENFVAHHSDLIVSRLKNGFYRDCHGDLHSGNIFLLPEPVPFDCIEFNEDFRHIDVLNEIAFLCMDLDSAGRSDLSELFFEEYHKFSNAIPTPKERDLFVYYKSYRANIRAKVSSLRAGNVTTEEQKTEALNTTRKYLNLMNAYIRKLEAK